MNRPNEPFNPYAIWGESAGRSPAESITVGWALEAGKRILFSQYGPLVGGVLLAGLVVFVPAMLVWGFGPIVQFFLSPLTLGLPYMFVRAARGERVEFSRAFEGFQRYGPLLLLNLILNVLGFVATIPAVGLVMLLIFGVRSAGSDPWPIIIVLAIVGVLFGLTYLYVYTRLSFAPYLIMEMQPGRIGTIDAMKESWSMTATDAVPLFGLALVCMLMNIVGTLLLFLPMVLLTAPLTLAAMGAAYAHIRRRTNDELAGFCAYCGYDMRTIEGARCCPECGAAVAEQRSAT